MRNLNLQLVQLLRSVFLLFFSLLFNTQDVSAGLILEISRDFNVSGVREIIVRGNIITIRYDSGTRVMELPEGALESIILWAKQDAVGPFVFSVDGALVPGAPNYTAPSLPPGLASTMLDYDIYAHQLSLGEVPSDSLKHPLVKRSGNQGLLPYAQKQWLLNPVNRNENAIWYRRLAERYAREPGAIGEFTIIANPVNKGFPVQISARSHRWIRPYVWYLGKSVPSEWDHWALNLPYQPLKEDIEKYFQEYRIAFKPLDELASIVEVYCILNALRTQNPTIWNKVIKDIFGKSDQLTVGEVYGSSSPYLQSANWDDYNFGYSQWNNLVLTAIGDKVETTAEAELAIARLWSDFYDDYNSIDWEIGIESMAENNKEIKAKWMLLQIKWLKEESDTIAANQMIKDFFSFTKKYNDLLRIRIAGYQLIKGFYIPNTSYILNPERDQIISDYIRRVNFVKKQVGTNNKDYTVWEDLSQCVYSAGLISMAKAAYFNRFDPKLSEALAYVHYRRGIADQRGMEIAYRHAHFRFLYYLKQNTAYNKELFETIDGYRAAIAKILGMEKWEEQSIDWSTLKTKYERYAPNEEVSDESSQTALPKIEGTLIACDELFKKDKQLSTDFNAFSKGIPAGIKHEGENFSLLLVDSRVFLALRQKFGQRSRVKVRAEGILHDEGRAFTPLKMEYFTNGTWIRFDLPFAGTNGPFSLTGGQ